MYQIPVQMKKCVVFSRVSSAHQSAEEQTKELYAEAYRNGYKDDEIEKIEDTESAIKLAESERITLQQLYDTINTYPIECVICRELSRIARRPDVLYKVRDKLIQSRVQLIICNPYMKLLDDKGKLSQTANIMFSLFGSIAESEMSIKIERFKEGKLRKKRAGKWAGGWLPFGYTYDQKTHDILVVPEQRDVIIKIFDMYVNKGMSTVKIARHLNQTGGLNCCRTGNTIETAVSTIGSILKNPAYIGEHPVFRGKVVDNVYPAIIDKGLFQAAGIRLEKHNSRKNAKVKVEGKHIYYCSEILVDRYGNKLTGKSVANSYRFVRTDVSGSRYQITVPINLVDSIVWHFTKQYIERENPLTNEEAIKKLTAQYNTIRSIIKTNRKKHKQLDESILRTEERIVTGKTSSGNGDILIKKFKTEQDHLDDEYIMKTFEAKGLSDRIQLLKESTDTPLENASDELRSELIHKYIETVKVEPTPEWGVYELSIIYYDMNMDFATIHSMSKRAYNAVGEKISFEYLERFVRPSK